MKLINLSGLLLVPFLFACGGGSTSEDSTPSTSESNINNPPVVSAGVALSIYEGETVTFSATASDDDSPNLSYSWIQTAGTIVEIDNSDTLSASFTAPDLEQQETLEFTLTVNDGEGQKVSDTISVTISPYNISITQPLVIGSSCEFTAAIDSNSNNNVTSLDWSVLSDTNELIAEGALTDSKDIITTIPTSGNHSLLVTATFQNGTTAEAIESLYVKKSLPADIQSMDYTIESNESYVLCQNVNVWNDATLTLEKGASLASNDDTQKTIFMWGDITISGEEDDRVSIDNVVLENNFSTTKTTINVNAQYVDFISGASINNDDGSTNVLYSTFDSNFLQQDEGILAYNIFYKGLSLKPNGATISYNDIHCEGLESCISVSSYMFGDGFINAKPTIAYNNIFGATANSITYDSDSFTNADIDMTNNYWGGKSITELNEVFVDANDTPDKSFVFLFDPMLENAVERSNTAPVANAGIDKTTVLNYGVSLDGTMSSDVDGDELSYKWTLVSKPTGSLVILYNNTDPISSLMPDVLGDYTIELTISDGIFESKDIITISALEDYTITYAPITPGNTIKICSVTANNVSFGGYYWTFNNCNMYGDEGNPVGVRITNNHPEKSLTVTQVGLELGSFNVKQVKNIDSASQYLGPNSSLYFKLNMKLSSQVTGGFFQLESVSGYSYGVQNEHTFLY